MTRTEDVSLAPVAATAVPQASAVRRFLENRTTWLYAGLLLVLWSSLPLALSPHTLTILAYGGIYAIGAIGLNLLVGHAGQISIGHGAFIAVGSYTAGYAGSVHGLPIFLWLPLAGLLGFAIGMVIGPFALRLSGFYLAIITFAMLIVAQYVFQNLKSVTGGGLGLDVSNAIPLLSTSRFTVLGMSFSREQGYFWLTWAFAVGAAVLARNILRARPGRAMRATREHDLAAEAIGVRASRVKINAFAWSSAFGTVAGGLYGALQGFVNWTDPPEAMLNVSIMYLAMIIIGGMRTAVAGPVLGALFVAGLQPLIEANADLLPFMGPDGLIGVAVLTNVIYGGAIVACLLALPEGLAGLISRINHRPSRSRSVTPTPAKESE
jgi:branched-chain amino acid transport system permease protein